MQMIQNEIICPKCNSARIIKNGKRRLKTSAIKQRYSCLDCNRKFSLTDDRIKITKEIGIKIMEFNDKFSLRNIQKKLLADNNLQISHSNILRYIWKKKGKTKEILHLKCLQCKSSFKSYELREECNDCTRQHKEINQKIFRRKFKNAPRLMFEEGEPVLCPQCKSGNINKSGCRYNLYSIKQEYRCKGCKYHFTFDDGTKRLKHPKSVVLFALSNSTKYSCRQISRLIKRKFNINISHATISIWMKKNKAPISYLTKEMRLKILIRNLKPYQNKIVKTGVIIKAGLFSSQSRLNESYAVAKGIIKPVYMGYYFVNLKKWK